MKIEQLRKKAETNKTPEPDPCACEKQQQYEDGMREGGQDPRLTVAGGMTLFNLRERLAEVRADAERARYGLLRHTSSPTIPRMPGQTLPKVQHDFLPMVCCARPDAHLGAVED